LWGLEVEYCRLCHPEASEGSLPSDELRVECELTEFLEVSESFYFGSEFLFHTSFSPSV